MAAHAAHNMATEENISLLHDRCQNVSMFFYSERLRKLVQKWPGKKTFGPYRFLPLFFIGGALLEFSMINWQVGQVNFYKVYKRRIVQEMVEDKLRKKEGEHI